MFTMMLSMMPSPPHLGHYDGHDFMARISANEVESTLESNARSLLLSSIRTIGDGTHTQKFVYPTSCYDTNVDGIVDSTTTLIAARTFSKIGRSDISWNFLRTVFSAQGSNGFLPRFVYLNHTLKGAEDSSDEDKINNKGGDGGVVVGAKWEEFIGPYPGPKLFPTALKEYIPSSSYLENYGGKKDETKVNIWSSNTLAASPHHATTILEVFYMSNQTNSDVDNLMYFYSKLQKWHDYLHAQVITNCSTSSSSSRRMQNTDSSPCLTVRHPWETEIEMSSLLWEYAMENVTKIVAENEWTPPFDIPAEVKTSFDYPGDDKYNALLFLLQCLSNHSMNENKLIRGDDDGGSILYSACPFQMIDVGFTSALSRSDQDMLQIGQILLDKNRRSQPSSHIVEKENYQSGRSKRMLNALWDDNNGTFLNRVMNLTLNVSNGMYQSNNDTTSYPLTLPAGSNYAALWEYQLNSTMVEEMSSHLIQHSGPFSHYCGDFPLWSMGGCGVSDSQLIHLLLNYRVTKGLRSNNQFGIAHFFQMSTLNLVCGLANSGEPNLTDCLAMQRFAWAFNGTTQLPVGEDECGLTSTLTAAIVLDFLHPEKIFKYDSEPPISSSSVIVLIAMELVIAFSVGLTCLLLSLNLMRRATVDDEGDSFVRILHERQSDEEILVRSPREDTPGEDMINAFDAIDDTAPSSLELIGRLFPSLFHK